MDDPYAVLGIPATATLAQAEAAFRERLREVHPDRHPDADDEVAEADAAATRALNDAIREVRYRLREVRTIERCGTCGTPAVVSGTACPVCGADPDDRPWWHDEPGQGVGALPPIDGMHRTEWLRSPTSPNVLAPVILAFVAIAAFALVFWVLTSMVARS